MQTVQTVTLEDVIALVVPPTSGGYLRLLSGDVERFFQPLGSRWSGLPGQPDGVDSFIIVNPADSFFSPCAWARPVTPSPMTSCCVLWASRTLALAGQQRSEPRSRLIDGETERAIAAFTRSPSHGWPSTVVLDEGSRVTALWKLERPIAEGHLRAALQALAVAYGGDRAQTEPAEALIAVPTSRCTTIYPAREVRVVAWEPENIYPADFSGRIS